MNIDDVAITKVPEGPLVRLIIGRQHNLMQEYEPIERAAGIPVPEFGQWHLDNPFVQYRLKDMFWRVTEELAEAWDCVPSGEELEGWWTVKVWKGSDQTRHFMEEVIDALHFLVEACIIGGVVFPPNMPSRQRFRYERITQSMWSIIFYMGKAANCLKNKPWKQTHMITDERLFHSVLYAAAWEFLRFWVGVLNGTERSLYVLYCKKEQVNQFRIRSEY